MPALWAAPSLPLSPDEERACEPEMERAALDTPLPWMFSPQTEVSHLPNSITQILFYTEPASRQDSCPLTQAQRRL